MEYRPLGRTGVKVSPLCLGAMMFGAWGNPDHDESIRIIHARARRRHQLHRHRRRLLAGRVGGDRRQGAAGGRRDDVVLATKFHGTMGDDPNQRGNSPPLDRRARSRTRCAGSSTDWIDLYQIHRPEPDTDIEETLGALTDLVHQGKVRYIGSSTFPAVADRRGAVGRARPRPASASSPSSRRTRCSCAASRTTCCPTCPRHGMGVIPWSPLAGGWLSGRWRKGPEPPASTRAERLPAALRPLAPGQPAQARGRRRARAARRGGRPDADPAGARLRAPPPGGHRADHRPAHDGAPRVPARRRRRDARPTTCWTASTRSSRPGVERQPRRRRLPEPGAGAGRAPALTGAAP